MKKKISISWSGGKDSSMMLHAILNNDQFEVIELHTTLSSTNNRVSMHGVSQDLVQNQADAIGLPIQFLFVEPSDQNDEYEKTLSSYYKTLKNRGITHIGFGDIFLEDLKAYRDSFLQRHQLQGVYPLWNQKTSDLAIQFIDLGFQSIICAANKSLFNHSICGNIISQELIDSFDDNIDPCGENGEFHSFAISGPIFQTPLKVTLGEIMDIEYPNPDGASIVTFQFIEIISSQ